MEAVRLDALRLSRPDGFSLGPISLSVAIGGALLVLGGNGSGKSTLAQLLCGWHPELLHADLHGEGHVLGQSLSGMALEKRAAFVQLVQQNPFAQLSGCAFTVEEEIVFGPENLGLPEAAIRERLEEALAALDCAPLRHRDPATLSGGEAQRVVLAAALAMHPQLLLLDEAFSRLSPDAIDRMLSALRVFCDRHHTTLICFERQYFPVAQHVSRVLVLQEGAVTALDTPEQAVQAAVSAGVVFPDVTPVMPNAVTDSGKITVADSAAEKNAAPETVLRLENITYAWPESPPCLADLSVNLDARGAALVGANGAGKSTLLRIAAGLLPPAAGSVCFGETPLNRMPARQRAATVGVLFQEAERQIFHATVEKEVLFGLHRQGLSSETAATRCAEALALFGLEKTAQRHPLDLHAGHRRLVAVACLAALRPPVLLLDEPSRDFDAACLELFERWLRLCRQQGVIVLAISHDQSFIRRQFSRVLRLEKGTLTEYEAE